MLAGCTCPRDPVTETAYAAMASYPTEIEACIPHQECTSTGCTPRQDCMPLCRAVLQIGDAEIQRCELVTVDVYDPGAPSGQPMQQGDLQQVRGATVRVTYIPDVCDDGSAADSGYDQPTDDGSTDDGSCDDGSCDGGSTDDGSCDDGSCDDGSTDGGSCDGGSCDGGSGDDGSGDDGSGDGGDATGDGSSPRHVPPPAARHTAKQRSPRAVPQPAHGACPFSSLTASVSFSGHGVRGAWPRQGASTGRRGVCCSTEATSVDVFGAALEARAFLCDAANAAGHELGVFEALVRGGPGSLAAVAARIGVAAGHRLRALLDVLAALGAIRGERGGGEPRFAATDAVPERPVVPPAGWGQLAEVIRRDGPLPEERDGDALRRLHHHLASAGAAAARELVAGLGAASLLDLGAGAGAYSKAFLDANPAGRATLVDTAEVLALAAEWLGPLAARSRRFAGDAAEVEVGAGHDAALLANVLHLHSPDACARLVAAAARGVAAGGVVVIKDLRVDDDRAGPIEGLLFALNMAIYTDAGDVYSTAQLRAWLTEAGLVDVTERRLAASPDAIVVTARKPAIRGDR